MKTGLNILKEQDISTLVRLLGEEPTYCPNFLGLKEFHGAECNDDNCMNCWGYALKSEAPSPFIQIDMTPYIEKYIEVSGDKKKWIRRKLFTINKNSDYKYICYEEGTVNSYLGHKYARPLKEDKKE